MNTEIDGDVIEGGDLVGAGTTGEEVSRLVWWWWWWREEEEA